MTTTSANPDNLNDYVLGTPAARDAVSTRVAAAVTKQASVSAASTSHGVNGTVLPLAKTLIDNMIGNEEFVRAVRDALLAADRLDGIGISDNDIALRLASGDYATDPVEYEMPEVAMIGLPANSGFVDDPICAANGNFVLVHEDIEFFGLSSPLALQRVYNSMAADRIGVFGAGWSCALDVRLTVDGDRVLAALDDGALIRFVDVGEGGWITRDRRRLHLERASDGWVLRRTGADAGQFTFDLDGMLTGWSVGDSAVTVERNGSTITRYSSVASGRVVELHAEHDCVIAMTTDDDRSVRFDYDEDRQLLSASSSWARISYSYESGLMTTSVDADGVAEFVNVYDGEGRVIEQTSPFGRVTNYRYQMPGATVITDEAGVRQAMVHDARGNLTSIIDVDGSATRYTYDALDRMVKIVDRSGNETVNEFDGPSDRLSRRIDPDGHEERWSWDSDHRVVAHTMRNGATLTFEYSGSHRTPVKIECPDGSVTKAVLDARGLPISIIDADGVVTEYRYDRDGQVVEVIDALGNTVNMAYDTVGRQVGLIDEVAAETRFEHDGAGRLVEVTLGDSRITYAYSAAGRPTSGTLAGELPWSAVYGSHGRAIEFADGAGGTVQFAHDTHGHVVETVTADGVVHRHEYDAVGQLVATVDAAGNVGRLAYDRNGNAVEVVDPVGNVTRRTVDSMGRTTSIVAADGATTRFTHHPLGEVASVTMADGGRWTFEFDDFGRVIAAVDPSGARSTKRYSPAGRLIERITPAGRSEVSAYDERGLLASLTRTDGSVVAFERDARGLVVGTRHGGDEVQAASWDTHRRLASVTSPNSGTVRYERDSGGRVTSTVDATGVTRRFQYDTRGLLARAIDGAGCSTDYERDARGRLVAQVAPGDRRTTWSHGLDGRMNAIVDPVGVSTEVKRDANGRILGYDRGDLSWARQLDPCGRERSRASTDGSIDRSLTRDWAGRITAATSADHSANEFLWDDRGCLLGTSDAGGSTTVTRDPDGAVTGVIRPSAGDVRFIRDSEGSIVGALGGAIEGIVDRRPVGTFDAAGRLLGGPDGSAYAYDASGRLVERSTPRDGVTQFSYDDTGLIATETRNGVVRSFTYDRAGRVDAVTVEGGGTTQIQYDSAGRRVKELHPDGSTTVYRWSTLDQLTGLVRISADGSTDSIEIRLDGLGRPASINGRPIGYDPLSGQPSSFGETELTRAGSLRWNSAAAGWEADGSDGASGVAVGGVRVIGCRTYDPETHQFLSPDPLFTVPGSSGGASAYTYAWQDPVNFVDPSGLQPISVEQYDAIIKREQQGTIGAVVEAMTSDPWGTLAMAGVIVAGVGLTFFVPGGQAIGVGLLLGVGATVVGGLATGEFDPRKAALNGVIGGATFGVGSALNTGRIGMSTFLAANGGLGMTQKFGEQTIDGQGYDVSDIFLAGGISTVTAGIGERLQADTVAQAVLYGGGVDAGGETVNQLLDSNPGFSVAEVVSAGVFGGGQGAYDFHVYGGSSGGSSTASPSGQIGSDATVVGQPQISEVSVEIRPGAVSGAGQSGDAPGGARSAGPPPTIEVAPLELTVTSINAGNVTVAGADGTTTRIDHHVTMSDGSHQYVEVRPVGTPVTDSGDLAVTENMRSVIPDIESGVAAPRGAGAESIASATGGAVTGPTTVVVVPAGTEIRVGSPIGGPL